MKKTWVCWLIAVVVTLGSVLWQRLTGPTHPARGVVSIGGEEVRYRLARSHSTSSNQAVRVEVGDPGTTGQVVWRRFPTDDSWSIVSMERVGGELVAELPKQPAAGKLEYQVRLARGAEGAVFPARAAVTRFRGDVPMWILVAHIAAMFLGMLFAARAAMEAATGRPNLKTLAWTGGLLVLVGGFILGPLVLKYAFGEWWGGFPFGNDLTDNKMTVAGIAWAFALWSLHGGRQARMAVLVASVVTLAVFAIPHSMWGSEIKWNEMPAAPTPRPPA